MADDYNLPSVLQRLSKSDDPIGIYARSMLNHDDVRAASLAADNAAEHAEREGTTDPFAYDPNIKALLDSGVIAEWEKDDPVALSVKLASVLIRLRDEVADSYAPEATALNGAEVDKFTAYYSEKLQGRAQLEIVYDDPILFANLSREEAAGLARALITISKRTCPLWDETSVTGRRK